MLFGIVEFFSQENERMVGTPVKKFGYPNPRFLSFHRKGCHLLILYISALRAVILVYMEQILVGLWLGKGK